MNVYHPRLDRTVRMSRPHRLFARDRETVDVAYPGDVIGLTNPGLFVIGDTVSSGAVLALCPNPALPAGTFRPLAQQEHGEVQAVQQGTDPTDGRRRSSRCSIRNDTVRSEPILAAVGQLQFDVVVARLAAEYQVEARIEALDYTCARWVKADDPGLATAHWPPQSLRGRDRRGNIVALFSSEWAMNYCIEKNPQITFYTVDDLIVQTDAPWFTAEHERGDISRHCSNLYNRSLVVRPCRRSVFSASRSIWIVIFRLRRWLTQWRLAQARPPRSVRRPRIETGERVSGPA